MAEHGTARAWVCWSCSKVRVPKSSSLLPGGFFSRQRLHVFWGIFLHFSLESWTESRQIPGVPAWSHSPMPRRMECLFHVQMPTVLQQGEMAPSLPSRAALPCLSLSCRFLPRGRQSLFMSSSPWLSTSHQSVPATFLNRAAAAREISEGGRLMPFSLCLLTYGCPWQQSS